MGVPISREDRTMPQVLITPTNVVLKVSASETAAWAGDLLPRKHGAWPCSSLAGHRLVAEFNRGGLLDLRVDGREDSEDLDLDGRELSALCADFLRGRLSPEHPAYEIAVGQFDEPG